MRSIRRVPVLVRAHREYLPGDVFGYLQRNTRDLLRASMAQIAAAGEGVILYLKRESNAIANELNGELGDLAGRASTRLIPPEADFRDYGIGAQILRDIGVRKMILLSDSAPRLANLPGYGLEIVGSEPLTHDLRPPAARQVRICGPASFNDDEFRARLCAPAILAAAVAARLAVVFRAQRSALLKPEQVDRVRRDQRSTSPDGRADQHAQGRRRGRAGMAYEFRPAAQPGLYTHGADPDGSRRRHGRRR